MDRLKKIDGHHVWCIGRRRGKTHAALAWLIEMMLEVPNGVFRYLAKTEKSAEGIVLPTLRDMLQWAPPRLGLETKEAQHRLVCHETGATLIWSGVDAKSFERQRGGLAHGIVFDEAGFYQDFPTIESAMLPLLDTTGGKALYSSTPPRVVGHPFVKRLLSAENRGRAARGKSFENPRLTDGQKKKILQHFAEHRGMSLEEALESSEWRREYGAEIVQDTSRAALPAWCEEIKQEVVCDFGQLPPERDTYVALDFGFGHGHGALFFSFDYPSQRMFCESAIYLRRHTVAQFAAEIKAEEKRLWGVSKYDGSMRALAEAKEKLEEFLQRAARLKAEQHPYMRVGDNNMLAIAELSVEHGLSVIPTQKTDKHMAVDATNDALRRKQIIIHPRCVSLVDAIESTQWNRTRNQWVETEMGHGELVDALVYGWRNIVKSKNPRLEIERAESSYFRAGTIFDTSPGDGWSEAFE